MGILDTLGSALDSVVGGTPATNDGEFGSLGAAYPSGGLLGFLPDTSQNRLSLIGGALKDIGQGANNNGQNFAAAQQQLANRYTLGQQIAMARMRMGLLGGAASSLMGGSGDTTGAAPSPQATYAANQPAADALSSTLTGAGLPSTPATPPVPGLPGIVPSNIGPTGAPSGILPMGSGAGGYGPSPGTRQALALYALASDKPSDAYSIMAPHYAVGPGGQTYDQNSGSFGPRIPDRSYVNGWNVDPNAPTAPAYLPSLPNGIAPNGQGAVGNLPGYVGAMAAQSGATANAQQSAQAAYDLTTVPNGDGSTSLMPRLTAAQILAGVGPGGSGAPRPGVYAGFGTTPGPAQTTFNTAQATDASTALSADMNARPTALQNLNDARTALGYIAQNRNTMNPTAGFNVASNNYLRTLPGPMLQSIGVDPTKVDQFANNATVYQQLGAKDLLSFSKSNLPSRYTEREMAVANRVIPQLTTAPDAAAFHWGLQAAIANKALQRADFASSYRGAPSRQAVEQTWNATPQGQASLYQDPVWQNVTIGGQPAVTTFRNPKDGRLYGQFAPGSGQKLYFPWVGGQ